MEDINNHLLDLDPDNNYYDNNINENHIFSIYDSVNDFINKNPISLNDSNFLSVVSQNIRSINQNLDNFLCLFSDDNMPDIFILSETWHSINTPVVIPGYLGYHTIRQGRAGGVSVFIKNQLNSCFIEQLSFANDFIETCTIKVSNSQSHVYVCGIYRPHIGSIDSFTSSLETILNNAMFVNSTCVFAGDFNANLLSDSGDVHGLVDMMRSHHYIQVITDVTRPGINQLNSSLIDHIWLNSLRNYNCGILKSGITDHHTLFIQLPFVSPKSCSERIKITFRDYSPGNQHAFENNVRNFDWETIKSIDINQYTLNFIESLNTIFQNSYPIRSKYVTNKYFKNPWHTKEVEKLTNHRKLYHNLLSEGLVSHADYAIYRNKVTSLLRKCKQTYYNRIFSRNMGNVKACWKLINKICKDSQNKSIKKINFNGTTYNNPSDIAESFNKYFTKIAEDLASNLPNSADSPYSTVTPNTHEPLILDPVSPEECSSIINSLKDTKQDINHIPVKIFKEYHRHFLHIVCDIINKCFEFGVFPDCLKHAAVTPIFKKGDSNDICNYRPIAILPFFSKIIERCISSRITNYATTCNLFSPNQFGFTKGKSTQDAIILITERIYDCFNKRDGTFCINAFVDFKKCFDTLNHIILCNKMKLYGIIGTPIDLILDYLTRRTQSVRINNVTSSPRPITIGVPQGSILGPLLFIFFINDLPNISDNFVPVLFADDLTVSFNCTNIAESNVVCNNELEKLYRWATANKLSINFGKNKTYYIVHTYRNLNYDDLTLQMSDNILENLDEGLFLGVVIDKKLTYRSHIEYISLKISKSIGVLYKLSRFKVSKSVLKQVYYSLIHSYLNYNICCYSGTYNIHINRLLLLQKRAIRIISNTSFLDHTDPLFYSNGILKVHDMYKLNVGLFMFDRWHTGVYNRTHSYDTRSRNDLLPSQARLTITQNSLSVIGPNIWNSIPQSIQNSMSRNSFKSQYKKYLLSFYINV